LLPALRVAHHLLEADGDGPGVLLGSRKALLAAPVRAPHTHEVVVVIGPCADRRGEGPREEREKSEHGCQLDRAETADKGFHPVHAASSNRERPRSQLAPSMARAAAKAADPTSQTTVGPMTTPLHHHSASASSETVWKSRPVI